jgi:ectoine hydroxylase-related dioxygenase (phytanoyl-CoA dioxygenase family)
VRGSHKSNFSVPPGITHGDDEEFAREHLHEPATKAGDVILFSEATVHGAVPWRVPGKHTHVRTCALFL